MTENHPHWPEQPPEGFENLDDFDENLKAELIFDEAALPAGHRSGFIAVVGRPNVGKSTLMNAYLGQKIAIVSPKAQTTRNRLLGILTLDDAQLIFIDTPGIHEPHHKFGQYLVETALQAIPGADLILWLVDGAERPQAEDKLVAEAILKVRKPPPIILAMNKVDLLKRRQVAGRLNEFLTLLRPTLNMPLSATEGHNQETLLQAIIAHLPPGPRYFPADQVTDLRLRFIAGEMVREAALSVLRQEVPHALAIQVEEFKERSRTMTYISATLFVERESQKPIVIGRQGKTLKEIGQLARAEIEELVQTKVFLELRVKVQPYWRRRKKALERLGYGQRDQR